MERRLRFLLESTFFGLTLDVVPETRFSLFKQIHEIVFHGKGGYNWDTIYNMPIWLRKFTFHEIKRFYEKETESIENSKNQTLIDKNGKVNIPNFNQDNKGVKYK
jgi:hypothetical protein